MSNALFENVMTDVSGKIRLESEDPRWIQLFQSKNIHAILEDETNLKWYGKRLIEQNPVTGNLIQLIEQVSSRMQQISRKKTASSVQSIDQCCVAIHLCCILLHQFVANLSTAKVVAFTKCYLNTVNLRFYLVLASRSTLSS